VNGEDERQWPARQARAGEAKKTDSDEVVRAFVRAGALCYIGNGTVNLIGVNPVGDPASLSGKLRPDGECMIEPPSVFRGEEFLFALLLRMVQEHCNTTVAGELKSFEIEANADAIKALADAGYIEIIEQADNRVRATLLPAADALAARLLADKRARRQR
jgi:hypothetical protein